MGGGNNKCDVASATFAINKILRTNICHSSIHSNVPIQIDKKTTANLLKESTSGKSPRNVRTINVLNQLEDSTLAILDELTKVPGETTKKSLLPRHLKFLTLSLDYPFKGTGTAAVARVGGFIVRCLYERQQCRNCIEKLETINETIQQKSDFLKLVFETGNNCFGHLTTF